MNNPDRTQEQLLEEVRALRGRIAALERAERERALLLGALRQSEERYRHMIETASEGIWQVDAGWRTTFVNARLAAMLGVAPADMLGQHVFAFMDDEGQALARQYMERRQSGVKEVHDFKFCRRDGAALWSIVSATPLQDEAGHFAGALALVTDITERKQAEGKLREYADRLENLSRRLLGVQEAERRHLARELHDEVGQELTCLKLVLKQAGRGAPAVDGLDGALALVDGLLTRVRSLSSDLRPALLDHLGLLPALLWLVERFTGQTGVCVDFRHAGLEGGRFAVDLETAAFRVVQEALTNVARHAGTVEASVRVWATAAEVVVQIEDRGAGFDAAAALAGDRTAGLAGMRERVTLLGGRFALESAVGSGTSLTARLPLLAQNTP
jgi:PAS domain S-box-containing protein